MINIHYLKLNQYGVLECFFISTSRCTESYILPFVGRKYIFTAIKSYDFQSVTNSTVTIKRLQLLNLISHITLLDV